MGNKLPATPELPKPKDKSSLPELHTRLKKNEAQPAKIWLWFSFFLVVGLFVLIFVSSTAPGWLKNIKLTTSVAPTEAPVKTLNVQRSADYAGLEFSLENAQYATSFMDDNIHPAPAILRLNMHVANKSPEQVSIVYYAVAHLLGPNSSKYNPTNVTLSTGPRPGSSESGWIDFAVPANLQLQTLQLQLGSTLLGESLVTIPFTGHFDGSRYKDRSVAENLTISYYFPNNNPQLLTYQLTSVDIRYSYGGSQVKAGQQYYVLNFRVTNPNSDKVSPGFGYDYIRLIYNGGPTHPPVDNTLPYGFDALKTTSGRVAFLGPAGIGAVTVDFLTQIGSSGNNYNVPL
jgi:hypothetical protein